MISKRSKRVGQEVRHHLRNNGEPDPFDPAAAGGAQALLGAHVDVLDHFEEHLAERADGVNGHCDNRRNGTERQDGEEKSRR